MKRFLLSVVSAVAFLSAGALSAEAEENRFFCRQVESIDSVLAAMQKDSEYSGSEYFEATSFATDDLVAHGTCIELPSTDVAVLETKACTWMGNYCIVRGEAVGLLPPEAGATFISGYALYVVNTRDAGDEDIIQGNLIELPEPVSATEECDERVQVKNDTRPFCVVGTE